MLTFFKWQAVDWRWKARELENKPLISMSKNPVIVSANVESQRAVRDGKIAYAYQQVSICDWMNAHFVRRLKSFPAKLLYMEGGDAHIWVECH